MGTMQSRRLPLLETYMHSPKHMLVTGGAGFIGGHLVDALLERGYRVRVLDTLAPPTHNGRLPEWFNKKAEFLKGDVRNKRDWVRALQGVDTVMHLAAYMDFHLDFSTYVRTNTESVALLYEVIHERKLPVQKIILASSQSVYGEGVYLCKEQGTVYPAPRTEEHLKRKEWEIACPIDGSPLAPVPQKETDLLRPTISYGISKRAAEELLFSLGRLYDIPVVALRYSIVHGAHQSFRHFYSGSLRQLAVMALGGDDLELHEDGNQLRDFVNVHDVVSAHLVALENPKADFGVFNVGSGRATRVRELAETVMRVVGTRGKIRTPGLFRTGTPRHSLLDVSKLTKLGWRPRQTLEDSVREYVAWIRNYPEAKRALQKTLTSMRANGTLMK